MGHDPLCDALLMLAWLWLGILVYGVWLCIMIASALMTRQNSQLFSASGFIPLGPTRKKRGRCGTPPLHRPEFHINAVGDASIC